ncbi:hypothetical protein [Thermus sp.]|uniref:hypothetical protein n=1 Tax=Thermus sp. TaxID=275 RepID=UPI0025F7278B|nr:hypothetical protein [Thermus sp.]MCS6869187.1 hypothetical protein [Thermus sp.]
MVHLVQGSSWKEEEKAEAVVVESPEGVLAWTEAHMPRWAEAMAGALGMRGGERKGLG